MPLKNQKLLMTLLVAYYQKKQKRLKSHITFFLLNLLALLNHVLVGRLR